MTRKGVERMRREAAIGVALASSDRDLLADLRPAAAGSVRLVHLDFESLDAAAGGDEGESVGDAGAGWTLRHFFCRAR